MSLSTSAAAASQGDTIITKNQPRDGVSVTKTSIPDAKPVAADVRRPQASKKKRHEANELRRMGLSGVIHAA